nr:hypothetical protein [Hymenobacter nivis]
MRLPPVGGPQLAQFGGRSRIQGGPQYGYNQCLGGFLPPVKPFGVQIQRPRNGLGQAALLGQAQGSGTEARVILAAFIGFWRVVHDEGKILPSHIQI